jgi:hypothetical protein
MQCDARWLLYDNDVRGRIMSTVLDEIMGNTLCRGVSAESISAECDQPMVNKVDVVILL